MYKIAENGIITLTTGNSFIAPLCLFLDDDAAYKYKLEDSDKVYLSIMKPHCPFEHGSVRKIYTVENTDKDGDVLIILDAEDTENLEPGLYYYEIKLSIKINGIEYVDTVVPKRKFYLL